MKREKTAKEILTKDKIKLDLACLLKRERSRSIWILILAPILLVTAILGIISSRSYPWERIEYLLYSIAALVALVYAVIILRRAIIDKRKIKNAEFEVTEDTLVGSTHDARVSRSAYDNRHLLQFSRHGEYYIPYGTNYKWSKDYYMSDDGVFNTALVGDTFYVVTYRKDAERKPIVVYNAKQFEYKEDAPFGFA